MTAGIALQTALVSRLNEEPGLAGVFHDAPARAGFPYAVLNCSDEKDWSCKGRLGREIALQLVLWDDQPSRLQAKEASLEMRLATVTVGSGWHLSTLILTGKRRSREPSGPWSCMFELRARLLEDIGSGSS